MQATAFCSKTRLDRKHFASVTHQRSFYVQKCIQIFDLPTALVRSLKIALHANHEVFLMIEMVDTHETLRSHKK
ncbi:hypothetical protein L596_024168 [Steinernema carpocapsae]|uniref:Uncharacterized protein n=1 Tax=Steinernema carpocapsae TaxID=34508 RepID=A0A4U5MFY2_STECR|nr:hypothetical protein L596_024168 [Steinernema carpocapsae]